MSDEPGDDGRAADPSAERPGALGSAERAPRDVVIVGDPNEGGAAPVVRVREDRIEAGELRPLEEGKPIHGELVQLSKRGEHPRLFDVEVLARKEPPRDATARGRKGPALVNSQAFRDGWEQVFGDRELN